MTPQSKKNTKTDDKQIISLINAAITEHKKSNRDNQGFKKMRKSLTEAQITLIKELDEKSKLLFDLTGDENREYQGTW